MSFFQRWTFFILAAIVLYLTRGIITPFVIAAVLAYIFTPVVDSLTERLKLPRFLAILLLYVVVFGGLGLAAYVISGRLSAEVSALSKQGPDIIANAVDSFTGGGDIALFGTTIHPAQIANGIRHSLNDFLQTPTGALEIGKSLAEGFLNLILLLLVLFYLLLDWHDVDRALLRFVPADRRAHFSDLGGRIHNILGFYLRGQLLLIVLISAVMFVILEFIFGLPFALPIAILSGVLEIIPLVGPALAAVIAAVVALASPNLGVNGAIWILITYFVVRQLEDQLVMPIVVGRAVHLHPVITTFAVLAGGAIAGILGTLLAVPLTAAANVVIRQAYPPLPDEPVARKHQPMLGAAFSYARQRMRERNASDTSGMKLK